MPRLTFHLTKTNARLQRPVLPPIFFESRICDLSVRFPLVTYHSPLPPCFLGGTANPGSGPKLVVRSELKGPAGVSSSLVTCHSSLLFRRPRAGGFPISPCPRESGTRKGKWVRGAQARPSYLRSWNLTFSGRIFWGILVSPCVDAPARAIQNRCNFPVWFWLRQGKRKR